MFQAPSGPDVALSAWKQTLHTLHPCLHAYDYTLIDDPSKEAIAGWTLSKCNTPNYELMKWVRYKQSESAVGPHCKEVAVYLMELHGGILACS